MQRAFESYRLQSGVVTSLVALIFDTRGILSVQNFASTEQFRGLFTVPPKNVTESPIFRQGKKAMGIFNAKLRYLTETTKISLIVDTE